MKAWLSEPSLYMVYSFDLLNVHVRVKIEGSHTISNFSSITPTFFTLYCALQQTQIEHLLSTSYLQGPVISCHTHPMGQSIIINNEVK